MPPCARCKASDAAAGFAKTARAVLSSTHLQQADALAVPTTCSAGCHSDMHTPDCSRLQLRSCTLSSIVHPPEGRAEGMAVQPLHIALQRGLRGRAAEAPYLEDVPSVIRQGVCVSSGYWAASTMMGQSTSNILGRAILPLVVLFGQWPVRELYAGYSRVIYRQAVYLGCHMKTVGCASCLNEGLPGQRA